MDCPPAFGVGRVNMPYGVAAICSFVPWPSAHAPHCWMAQYPDSRLEARSDPLVPCALRGAMPFVMVSCHSCSADTTSGESNVLCLPPAAATSPPAIHMNGYQVKFWYAPTDVSNSRPNRDGLVSFAPISSS